MFLGIDLHFVLFDLENQDPLLLKEKLCKHKVGKHSIHITDTALKQKKSEYIFYSGFKIGLSEQN